MNAVHADAGIEGDPRLVHDDIERLELVRRSSAVFGGRLLAYCVMDTHVHFVLECGEADAREGISQVFRGYTRFVNARRGTPGRVRRGAVNILPKPDGRLVAKAISYDHKNPLRTHPPLVAHEVEFVWSSVRAFARLARTDYPNVARARSLMGDDLRWALPGIATLEGLERAQAPTASPPLLLAAVAQTYGLLAEELVSDLRAPVLVAARRAFVTLGRLETYVDRELAPWIARSRAWINKLVADDVDLEAVRTARTLLRFPTLRARLRPPATLDPAACRALVGTPP